jgi:YVTN family beta-propeller protein
MVYACGDSNSNSTANAMPELPSLEIPTEPVSAANIALFESGPVRTVALSPSGNRLFVTNIPDGKLEIFNVSGGSLRLVATVPVGTDPVAVAARSDDEVWVVNHLSDNISIVRVEGEQARVVKTLYVGDEPRDIVFDSRDRAYITAAYRGQHHPTFVMDDLKKPGLGRADVWVFDANNTGNRLGGTPLTIINLFADTPRALAVTSDGKTVYAAAFLSGNQTTSILNRPGINNAKQAPTANVEGIEQPNTGLIVGYDGTKWVDDGGTDFSNQVMFDLPDYDVFVINADQPVPALADTISGVGTVLFNMVVNPATGALYVTNTEARNRVRFEGGGSLSTTVRGHIAESRISVIQNNALRVNHLNPHVDFSLHEGDAIPAEQKARTLAQPMDMVIDPAGDTLYLAAFSSNKIAAISTAQLESGTYQPNAERQVLLPGGAPAGLALNADGTKLFVLSSYDNSVSVIDTASLTIESSIALYNPQPESIRRGRRILYDADLTSSNGTSSCGSCHIFGDFDGLAWDLGDPEGSVELNTNPFVPVIDRLFPLGSSTFHPMKGPMTTQTFRGIADSGPMHWRGDRKGDNRQMVNGELESLEAAAFKEFDPAFVGLLGRERTLEPQQLQDFTDFSLAIMPPPNPIRALDNQLNAREQAGLRDYNTVPTTANLLTCNHCHALDVSKNHFGTAGLMTTEGAGITEQFKVTHLRNVYAKVGMFGSNRSVNGIPPVHMGPQIKGFGHLHDGAIDTIENFLGSNVFNLNPQELDGITALVFAFDSNYTPIVGQQLTLGVDSDQETLSRLDMFVTRALVTEPRPECDLIVKGYIDGAARGALMLSNREFKSDKSDDATLSLAQLVELSKTPGQEMTFTCAAPLTGERLGIDRDLNGILDGDE